MLCAVPCALSVCGVFKCKRENQIFILLFTENLPKTLSEFHVGNSARLKADDFLQNYQLVLNIKHK